MTRCRERRWLASAPGRSPAAAVLLCMSSVTLPAAPVGASPVSAVSPSSSVSSVRGPLVTTAVSSTAAATEVTPPRLLHRRVSLTPPELRELPFTPEVDLAARIDPNGLVAEIEVLAVRPTTENDEIVRRATTEMVRTWHYVPARRADGTAVDGRLEWTIRFATLQHETSDAVGGADEPVDPLRSVAPPIDFPKLTEKARIERLEGMAAIADRALAEGRRAVHSTPRFLVVTDAEQEGVAEILANNFEASFGVLDGLFGRGLPLLPPSQKVLVYLYSSQSAFASAAAGFGMPSHHSGVYIAPGLVLLKQTMASDEALLQTLLHEATHAYMSRHLARPGIRLGTWFVEGLAEYIGNSTITGKGELVVGKTIKRRYMMDPHGLVALRTTASGWTLENTKEAIRKGEATSIAGLLPIPPELFTGRQGPLNYGTSWLLIHFLRHGDVDRRGAKGSEGEWAEKQFPTLLLYLLEGYPAEDALEQVYGMTLSDLQEQFVEYVRRF